jgi:drug/metabolite transporter (DMT)-like permease
MDPQQVQRLRAAWAVALVCVTGVALFTHGFFAAVTTAVAFVGASVLAVVAFILWLLLGEEPVPLRALLIVLFFAGLVVEVGGLMSIFGLIR